jgi:hypothetical protein
VDSGMPLLFSNLTVVLATGKASAMLNIVIVSDHWAYDKPLSNMTCGPLASPTSLHGGLLKRLNFVGLVSDCRVACPSLSDSPTSIVSVYRGGMGRFHDKRKEVPCVDASSAGSGLLPCTSRPEQWCNLGVAGSTEQLTTFLDRNRCLHYTILYIQHCRL